VLAGVGALLARFDLVSAERARETTDLAWPRIVTGLARMSKGVADVAMVGVALGPTAIAGMGFAGPYWGMTFAVGGGMAAGTIALVSQRFGAGARDELGQVVRSSAAFVTAISVPVALLFWLFPAPLVDLLSDDPVAVAYGADYLRVLAVGVPFAVLNQIGSRVLVGANDAWTPMVVRSTGAVTNIVLNAVFVFVLDMGVVGAALGTVIAGVLVTTAFVVGLACGRLPLVGAFPIQVDWTGRYVDRGLFADLASIGLPVVGRSSVWTVARFPILALVGALGSHVVAAYVISRRIWGLMNTPGWGFGLAASSLVGQSLGAGDEETAEAYGREITTFTVAVYVLAAVVVAVCARPIVGVRRRPDLAGGPGRGHARPRGLRRRRPAGRHQRRRGRARRHRRHELAVLRARNRHVRARDSARLPRRDHAARTVGRVAVVPRGERPRCARQLLPVPLREVEGHQPRLPARDRGGRLTLSD